MAYTAPPDFSAGDPLAADQLDVLSADIEYLYGVAQGVTFAGASVSRAAGTSIADDSWSTVTFTAEAYDFGGWWSSGTDIIVPAGAIPAGFSTIMAIVQGRAKFATNNTGNRAFRVSVNGTPIIAPTVPGISGDTTVWDSLGFLELAAGDVVTMSVWQNSGGALAASDMSLTVIRFAPAS